MPNSRLRRHHGKPLLTAGFACCLLGSLAACGSDDSGSGGAATPNPITWEVVADSVGNALLVTADHALNGSSVYGVIATRGIADGAGRSLQAARDFAVRKGSSEPIGDGPIALYSADPEAPGNPYPDERLVRADGTVRVPDRFALRGMPDDPAVATARALLRARADQIETLRGFSTTLPIRVALSARVDLATVTAQSLFFFERPDGETDLAGLLAYGEALGIDPTDVALGFSFPTQPIEDDLLAVQALLRERAGAARGDPLDLVDDDPDDDLVLGVFGPADPEFAAFFAAAPAVGTLVAGLVRSPDFRGPDGTWLAEHISGEIPAPEVELDFFLALPATGTPPFPVVLVQHGFGGTNRTVLDFAQVLAAEGLASIGITALAHGSRGSPIDLLVGTPFIVREIFRQTIADQMTVLRAIESGVDIDGDGQPELDPGRMSYLGISLGGVIGATLVGVEEILPVAVLNVGGARVALLGQSEGARALVSGELARQAELEVDDPVFDVFLQRVLEAAQHGMDSVEGLNFAPRWFLDPFPGSAPHRVLLQEGIGDAIIDNESTEALAMAGGLIANTPMNDPAGVSGLWRFDPPGGHLIISRPDVLAQAIRFLASDGTEIIDPSSLENAARY